MAKQFEKPGQALKPASGFLHSGATCPLNPKEINRRDYCHRFFICSKQKKIAFLEAADRITLSAAHQSRAELGKTAGIHQAGTADPAEQDGQGTAQVSVER